MTKEDAIKTLKELWRETNDPWYEEVYSMAIDALEADRKTEPQTDCDNCMYLHCNYECGEDEPQTEMTTEQIVNELLSIKQILDDGKMPKQRCGNCKHLTYRWNKTWCAISGKGASDDRDA